ncbi:hypothetical protein AB0J81_26545 [Streptomyces bobili]
MTLQPRSSLATAPYEQMDAGLTSGVPPRLLGPETDDAPTG